MVNRFVLLWFDFSVVTLQINMKEKIRNDKVKSLRKKTRKGKRFHGVPWWIKDKMQVDTVVDNDDEEMEVELAIRTMFG